MGQMARDRVRLTSWEVPGAAMLVRRPGAAGVPTALVTGGERWTVNAI